MRVIDHGTCGVVYDIRQQHQHEIIVEHGGFHIRTLEEELLKRFSWNSFSEHFREKMNNEELQVIIMQKYLCLSIR